MPKYRQIADEIKAEIESGKVTPGHKLGSTVEIADRFECGFETAKGAIAILKLAGLVDARPGLGVFVTAPAERKQSTDVSLDSLPDSVMMLIMQLSEERDTQHATTLERLDELKRSMAELRLGDERDEQFAFIQKQLDKINLSLTALTSA